MCTSTSVLKPAATERVHYFSRQLITADDMTAEQEYFREKLRRHNRYLHGWGVVCGCAVEAYPDANHPWQVRICPGYVITPQGDEILIGTAVNFDLAGDSLQIPDPCANYSSTAQSGCGTQSANASPVKEDQPVYLAVCYAECETRPVRVHPVGCACDESACDYSRIRDSFELMRLSQYPNQLIGQVGFAGPFCPPCTNSACVVLAAIRLPRLQSTPLTNADISYRGFGGGVGRKWLFSVAQLPTPPMIIASSPQGQGAAATVASQGVSLTFDHPMDSTTINVNTIQVASSSSAIVPGQWTYDTTNRIGTFTPTVPFAPDSYTVTVSQQVKDVAGDPIPGKFIWNFVVVPPISGSIVNSAGAGVSGASVGLLDSSGNTLANAVSAANGSYQLTDTEWLTAGTAYTVKIVSFPAGFTTSNPPSQTFTWQGVAISLKNFVLS